MTPVQIQNMLQQAIGLHRAGRLEQADAIYSRVRSAAPRNFDAWHLAGTLALQQNRLAEATDLLVGALRIDPNSAVCQMRLGVVLLTAGRGREAEPYLRKAVQLQPDFFEAWDNLAYCLKIQDKLSAAVECHRKVTTLKPGYAAGWYNYGLTLSLSGRSHEALRCHEKALAADANYAEARFGMAQALYQCHRTEESIAAYDRYLQDRPGHLDAWSYRLLALNNQESISREALFAAHLDFGRLVAAAHPPAPQPAELAPDRRLRVAVISPDFRVHSCAYFIEPLLQRLDREQFELYLYMDHFREDMVTEHLRGMAKVWRNFVGLGCPAVEKIIRADHPDILIDLSGHTGVTNRLPLFSRRVAPVQITYLGYPNTTGLTEMDYRFTDAWADPVGEADAFASEKLVRFAPSAWTYAPPNGAPVVGAPPCRTLGTVTFGCFNSLGKLTDSTISLWGRLLAEVPGSRLLLKARGLGDTPEVRQHLLDRLRKHGVPAERVELLERTQETMEHLALYHRVDVALDTFPYHGTTTTCEAIWMGVPVVTQAGDRHVSRVGVSLLQNLGHPEWIAATPEDYVRIARELVSDPERLQRLRAGLRQELAASPIMNQTAQADAFAAALRHCWREKCGAAV